MALGVEPGKVDLMTQRRIGRALRLAGWMRRSSPLIRFPPGAPKRLHELLIFNTRVVFFPSFHHQAQHNKI